MLQIFPYLGHNIEILVKGIIMATAKMWQEQKHGETEVGKDRSVEMEGYMIYGKQH